MMIEEAYRLLLINVGLQGTAIGQRVHHMFVPETSGWPACRFFETQSETLMTHDGPCGGEKTEQTEIWAKTPDEALALAAVLIERLDGYRGPAGRSEGEPGKFFSSCFAESLGPDHDLQTQTSAAKVAVNFRWRNG